MDLRRLMLMAMVCVVGSRASVTSCDGNDCPTDTNHCCVLKVSHSLLLFITPTLLFEGCERSGGRMCGREGMWGGRVGVHLHRWRLPNSIKQFFGRGNGFAWVYSMPSLINDGRNVCRRRRLMTRRLTTTGQRPQTMKTRLLRRWARIWFWFHPSLKYFIIE